MVKGLRCKVVIGQSPVLFNNFKMNIEHPTSYVQRPTSNVVCQFIALGLLRLSAKGKKQFNVQRSMFDVGSSSLCVLPTPYSLMISDLWGSEGLRLWGSGAWYRLYSYQQGDLFSSDLTGFSRLLERPNPLYLHGSGCIKTTNTVFTKFLIFPSIGPSP
jgi:hypothetical protein